MPPSAVIFSAALLTWAVRKLVHLFSQSENRAPYPPGPKPKPLIGNMFDFPTSNVAQTYVEWGKQYDSTILYAETLGNHVVVINGLEDAVELFENQDRARLYADRPNIPISKLLGWEYNFGLLPYGDQWRQHRKISQQNFSLQATPRYELLQAKTIRQMLQGLLEIPEEFEAHNKMLAISLTMTMMYGYEVKSIKDPVVTIADEAIMLGTRLVGPGGSFINIIPALRYIPTWFPGASSRKTAAKVRMLTEQMMKIPMNFVKRSFEEGTATSSLVTDFYERNYTVGASREEEEAIKSVAYTVYGAASDTLISSTGTFFYAMAINEDFQVKAHAELDRIVGSKRLPTLLDRESLPYVEAIYREVLRFMPPLPLAVPHRLTEDDLYKGYFLPKGTSVFPNIWAMTHDEKIYPDPYMFNPERFFDKHGNLNDDDRILAYSFGRRSCVGKHVASTTMWLVIASVLACFKISKSVDENGNEIEIDNNYEDNGFLLHKSSFKCSFRARSLSAKKLIMEGM